MKKVCFIGHRLVFAENEVRKQLKVEIIKQIENGYKSFTTGTHGDFDKIALSVCREIKKEYKDIKIEVVLTSMNKLKDYAIYNDIETIFYEVENAHYKQKITLSNQQMIDSCDTLICFVNENYSQSGAKTALKYAKKKGLNMINIYESVMSMI